MSQNHQPEHLPQYYISNPLILCRIQGWCKNLPTLIMLRVKFGLCQVMGIRLYIYKLTLTQLI
jgi:hypothetical protein